MNEYDHYSKLIMTILEKDKTSESSFINDFNFTMLNSLLLIMNNNVDQYLITLKEVDIDRLPNDSLDYFYYLEGRIRYLALTRWKEVYYKQNSQIGKEFTFLSESALEYFRFAYNASLGLALQYQIKRDLKKSILLFKCVYDFGFKSESILESIISCAILSRDWITARAYIQFVKPKIYRFLNYLFMFESRFPIITISYFVICLMVVTGTVKILFLSIPIIYLITLLVIWRVFRSRLFISWFGGYLALFILAAVIQLLTFLFK
jgi:hypothetical protein